MLPLGKPQALRVFIYIYAKIYIYVYTCRACRDVIFWYCPTNLPGEHDGRVAQQRVLSRRILGVLCTMATPKKNVWDLIPAAFWGEKLEFFRVKGIFVFWKMISWSDPCQKALNLDRKQESASRGMREVFVLGKCAQTERWICDVSFELHFFGV